MVNKYLPPGSDRRSRRMRRMVAWFLISAMVLSAGIFSLAIATGS